MHKIDVNMQYISGRTALIMAVNSTQINYEIVDLLLSQPNININLQDIRGLNALMLATLNYKFTYHIIIKLLDKGANKNLTDNEGYTAYDHLMMLLTGTNKYRESENAVINYDENLERLINILKPKEKLD